ncbi:hypothetical protein [Streptomyces glaucescens]|uniref:hypothetical protein n=1 Tax=Streptomyces glaucescens TaxID=1907 RepID=UPI000A394363|nr:hypothetical protein [Streptomyces glaucescens]
MITRRVRPALTVGLAAALLGVPGAAWAAAPGVPEVLRISDGPYAGFQLCGAQSPPTFGTGKQSRPDVRRLGRVEPQPHLNGTLELARPGAQPFRTTRSARAPSVTTG